MAGYRRFLFDIPLALAALFLVIVGIIMVFSASGVEAFEKHQQPFYYLVQQIIGAAAGLVVIIFLVSVKKTFFLNSVFVYSLLAVTEGLLLLCLFMPRLANVNRWVIFGGLRFQPSELARISLVLFLAHYLHSRKDRLNEGRILAFPLTVLFVTVILVLIEPDFGTAVFLSGLGGMMLFLGGMKKRHFLGFGAVLAVFLVFFLFRADYRIGRITDLIQGRNDPLDKSYQVVQSRLAVGSGGLLGVSLGQSTQKLYLPQAYTDFIFAILGEEAGLVGTVVTLSLFSILLWRGIKISETAPDPIFRLVAAGLTFSLVSQALWNLTIVLGLGPTKGIPLPFISYGRSSLLCSLAAVGILLHISQKKGAIGIKARL